MKKPEPNETGPTPADEAPKVVIIGDDSPHLVQALSKAFKTAPVTVETALSAAETEALVAKTQREVGALPALVVSDVYMAGKTGIELTTALKNRYPNIQVLLMSAFASEQLRKRATSAGAVGLIAKPFDLRAFRDLVLRLIT